MWPSCAAAHYNLGVVTSEMRQVWGLGGNVRDFVVPRGGMASSAHLLIGPTAPLCPTPT